MPPRGHSSSSHSSGSRSSSSSRSSGYSRSSSSYSRSSGSHSSSSRPSSSSSGYRASSSRGPSSHSKTSKSSRPVSPGGSAAPRTPSRPAPAPQPPRRPRTNQPIGFMISGLRPSYLYGRRHDYVYYPESWIDQSTGTSYAKGYYDENGQYYDSVAFQKDGQYENVVCHCPYCGQITILNLSAEDAAAQNLQCPHCGGPMEIQSELDDYVKQATDSFTAYDSGEAYRQAKKKRRRRGWLIALAVFVGLVVYGRILIHREESSQTPQVQPIQQLQITGQDTVEYGSAIVLEKTGSDSYSITSAKTGDKKLAWDSDADSWYDAETDCWLWYNTNVEPAVWQYWYEGISSDFEESGWMEHDVDGWYIEAYEGNWIELPGVYDTSALWYID